MDFQKFLDVNIKKPSLISVSLILLILWGIYGAFQMKTDYLPSIQNSTIMVTVKTNSWDAKQVKSFVSDPVVQTLRGMKGLEALESNSFNGGFFCSLYFPIDYDMERAKSDVQQYLAGFTMPIGAEKPIITLLSTDAFPIARIQLESLTDETNESQLRIDEAQKIHNRLQSLPGISEVRVIGEDSNIIHIELDQQAMTERGFTMEDIHQALGQNHYSTVSGKLDWNGNIIPIKVTGSEDSAYEKLKQMPVHRLDGVQTTLSAFADVKETLKEGATVVRSDGRPSVIFEVVKHPSFNVMDVTKDLHDSIKELEASLPKGTQLHVIYSRGDNIQESIQHLIQEGLLGVFFSFVSIIVFLRSFRFAVITAVSIPISLFVTTGLLNLMGISLNLLTMAGLIVAMGRVVDDSIVVVDQILRLRKESPQLPHRLIISIAVKDMAAPVVSSTLTTVCVFLPILMTKGMISSSFWSFSWCVILTLLVSMIVALLIIPIFAAKWGGLAGYKETTNWEPRMRAFWVLTVNKRKMIIGVSFAALLFSIFAAYRLPVNLIPTNGISAVTIKAVGADNRKDLDGDVKRMEVLLQKDARIQTFSSVIGTDFTPQFDDVFDEGGGWVDVGQQAQMNVVLKRKSEENSFIHDMQHHIASLPMRSSITISNQNISGDDARTTLRVVGADAETLNHIADLISAKLKLVPGIRVQEVESEQEGYQIKLDEKKLEELGLHKEEILRMIADMMPKDHLVRMDGQNIPVNVSLKKDLSAVDPLLFLGDQTIPTPAGNSVRLSELGVLMPMINPPPIRERNGKFYSLVTVDMISSDIGKATSQMETALKEIELPKGVRIITGGVSSQVREMILEAGISLLFTVILISFIVGIMFRGWRAPLSVIVSIPFAGVGAIGGLWVTSGEWNLSAIVGLLMLAGIVVTNSIVLVDQMEKYRRAGTELSEAVAMGVMRRIRPICMTACTTILTCLPLIWVSTQDTIVSKTLGVVVVGGMLSSTIVTLLVIPFIYRWLHNGRGFLSSVPHNQK
ncbi:efflux RND transporter permease subunit [Paenibacillus andongensis]|uniref:efflux RND transporter permease subunit n=1 Tax=Paenibacillus andongensis TaxID=2975482 RepID=UPI0021BBB195|nr:efflux RND transporter permease subunit [Paenibacillus andongensis]